ncbi:MAG: hypothetical protein ACKOED_17280 [Aestuariivirga sp.]|uniref:hypothetical protein n=1 Tax=Aestuariivirga sp. TaxID=2650926 RepID=UPI0038D1B82B
MSLARLAMRIASARALRGATLAEGRVHDSAIAPIDQTIAEERQPILIVTTDDHEMEVTGRELFHGNVSCDLVIEAAIAARVEVAGEESVITIPHTDEGMELALDLMEHQVMAALTRGRSDWSRVWMKLVPRVSRRLSRRGASVEKGVRFAARQIVLTCDLIEAPTDGAPIAAGTAWADLLAVMAADTGLAPVARMLRAEIEGSPLAGWRRAANMLGIHLETADAIGLGPVLDLPEDPEVLEEAILTGGVDPVIVNHHTALARIADA